MSGNQVSLYFHIPFCRKKCDYCHFYVIPEKDEYKEILLHGLHEERQRWQPELEGKEIISTYFGGGTPALFGPEAIGSLIAANGEITLEANPENVTKEMMERYRDVGINRVSLGVQALNDPLLKQLSRTHSAHCAIEAVQATFDAGITNITIDLMYDLPGQTLEMWKETLDRACELPITHLSLYNLTIEPHTVFYKYRDQLSKSLPSHQTSRDMYLMAIEKLEKVGLKHYEISAFAREGFRSIHNTGYWTGRPFLGFGPSAYSFWNGKRFRNVVNLHKYCRAENPIDFEEELSPERKLRESLVIALRLREGVDREKYSSIDFSELVREGFLEEFGGRLRLSDKGVLFYDTVAAELV